MNGKKKLRKRITAFLMTLVMVMTLVMSVEPMRVRAANTYKSGNGVIISSKEDMKNSKIKIGDIFYSGSYIKTDDDTDAVKETVLEIYDSNGKDISTQTLSKGYTFKNAMEVISVSYTDEPLPAHYNIRFKEVQLQATVSTAPTVASLKYTGSEQALLSSGGSANNGTMVYALGNNATSAPADNEFSTTIPTGTNAGTYYVWYMAKGNPGYSNSVKSCKTVTIKRATPTESMIPAAPTASEVAYGTKLSEVTLSNNWSWVDANASSIVPNVENSGYVAKYNGSIDTSNYDWTKYDWDTAPGWSFDSTTNKIQKTVVVPVTPIPRTEGTGTSDFTVPTNLSATYNSSKTLSEQIPLPANWAWEDGTVTPQVSDTTFTAVYTVPSPDNKNYIWEGVNGYANNGDTITITRNLPVTINKATQTATVNMENYDFGGNISTPTITGVQETPTVTYYYNTENSNEGGTEWKDMTSTTLDKGTYYMYATLSATDNYATYTTPTVSFTVNPKTMTGITVQSVDVTYDGAEHRITVSGYPEGATVSYGESEGTYDLTSSPAYKDARDTAYTVYFKITAKGYNDYTGSATVVISPKVAELSWGNTAFIYNGSVQTPSASVSNLCSTDTCTVTVTGGQKNYSDTAYTATATALSNSNYKLPVEDADRQTSFTIAQKELGITWGETEFTYNGSTQKPTATLAGVEDGDTDTCNVTVSGEKTDVGTDYTATASIDNDNYKLPENATKLFTISPKSLKADTVTVTLSGTGITGNVTDGYAFVWDGNRKSPVITVTDNETGRALVYETDFTVSGTEDARNIGTYYITLTGAGNYTNKVKITWKITKAIITPSVSLAGWVYGDTPNEPQITGAEITGDVTYTYYKDEACTVKTTAADGATEDGGVPAYAGSYYVKADVAETQNYEAVSTKTSFTISKKDVTVTPKSGQKKTYGEYDPELTYNAVLVGDDTLSGSLARAEGENVGSYSITQGTLANSNYNIIFTTGVTFSIEQKQLTDDMLSLYPVNYSYTGAMVSPTVCYHDDTTKVDGTNVTEADIDKYGASRSSDYGVYTIELEGKGNYKGNIYKQWCISPVQDVTVTYDGYSHKIAYTTGAGFDLKFKDADGNYTLTDVSEQTMPGVYRYDYRMIIDEETIDGYAVLTINKIPFVGTLNMAERIGYGETLRPSVTGCSSDGDITYYYKKQGQPNSAYTETKPVNVGNYTVKAVVDATATQAGGTLTKDFAITKGTLTPVNPDKAVYACSDNGTKSVTLHDFYNELDGVSYTLGDVTDDYDILADSSVSVSRTGEVSYTLTGNSTVDAEAVIKVIIKSTNYEDITVDVTIGVDASVPVITGVTDGKTYCTAQTITVEDDSLDKVEINGTEVTLTSENTYTLAATGTTYIIKATDRAGNSSTVTVTVNNGHTWQNNPVFTWNGYTSATAKFTCSVDANHTEDKNCAISHVTTPAKCLVDGKRVYTASVTVDGTTYTDTNPNEEVLTATGHHWVYDAEGDTLYAWCSGDCDYHGETKADAKSTLTIAATGATYDTEAYEQEKVSLKDKSGAAVTVGTFPVTGDALGTITYYLSDGITKTGTAADTTSGAAAEGAAPVNAGSYYAAITVSGKTAKASFTIGKKELGVTWSNTEFTYDQTAHKPTATLTGVVSGDVCNVTVTGEQTNAGTGYVATASIDNANYKIKTADETTTFNIIPKTIGISWTDVSFVYDGESHIPTATATGLVGDDACSITITGEKVHAGTAHVATATAVSNPNYQLPEDATTEFAIVPAELTITAEDAAKHIGKNDPEYTYKITAGALVEGDSLTGIFCSRTAGETAGEYAITVAEQSGSNPNYDITFVPGTLTIEDHVAAVDAAVAATCTKSGISEGSHCSVCNEVIVAQKEVPALGHDWSGEWTIVKEATATTDGKRETICTRDGCGQKKYETIPATGTPEEPENAGKLDKDAEVEPDAQIKEATLDNKKSELLDAIFEKNEKQQIQSGTDARVWLEVKRTDESRITPEDSKEVTKQAESIMGENPMITYFDADLFKQVGAGNKEQIHEPGIDIQVTIKIPDELLNNDRTMVREYKIIRLHKVEATGPSLVDILSGTFDKVTGDFTFKTDKFSTYAIAYTDRKLVTGVTLTPETATLTQAGQSVQLTATVAPADAANKKVTWTTSDSRVAAVDENGKVTAVGNGTCTITATTEDGSFTAICTIKVEIPDSDNGGNNGDINSGDNNQSNEDANTPANTKEDKKPNVKAPKTGDASNVTLWSLLLALSALALAGIRVARRKRSSSIEK